MEPTQASSSRGHKALLCLGFKNGEPCSFKAVPGDTVCKTASCIEFKSNWPGHHAHYLSFARDAKRVSQASHWRTTCQTMYAQQYENHRNQVQADNMALLYDEEVLLAIQTAEVQSELLHRERQLVSLRTMTLEELRSVRDATAIATVTANEEEYGFHAPPQDDDDVTARQFRASVAEIVTQFNSQSLE
jgi:hypothetical protein